MGKGKIVTDLLGRAIGALGELDTDLLKKQFGTKSSPELPYELKDGQYDFTKSAPPDSKSQMFMSFVDMMHIPTGTRIPAETTIRGNKSDFTRATGIPELDPDTARRVLMGEISLDEARKQLVRKNMKVVD
jgi:hypothetical protein|tara:strand:- start:756 stop:1148 length:393 start_codon:yes stop_codon:yes gene_type:complete